MKNILKVKNTQTNQFHVILGDCKYSYTRTTESFLGYLQSKANKRTEYGNATRQDRFFFNSNLNNLEIYFIATNVQDEQALNVKREIINRNGNCDSQFSSKL